MTYIQLILEWLSNNKTYTIIGSLAGIVTILSFISPKPRTIIKAMCRPFARMTERPVTVHKQTHTIPMPSPSVNTRKMLNIVRTFLLTNVPKSENVQNCTWDKMMSLYDYPRANGLFETERLIEFGSIVYNEALFLNEFIVTFDPVYITSVALIKHETNNHRPPANILLRFDPILYEMIKEYRKSGNIQIPESLDLSTLNKYYSRL